MNRFPWLLPLLAALLAYAISPWGELVWDDQLVVKQQMLAFDSLEDVFRPPAGIPQWSYDYFRPVTLASYLFDIKLFGLGNAPGAHAANLVYHALTTLLLWLLLHRLLRDRPRGPLGATMAAILFALHPIHTESVSWITGRSDLLATMLLIPALHLALKWQDRGRGAMAAIILSPMLYLLALLAKEVALAGLMIVPALMLLNVPLSAVVSNESNHKQRYGNNRDNVARMPVWMGVLLTWGAATWIYFALRSTAGSGTGELPSTIAELIGPPLQATAWYLLKIVVPWPQSNFVVAEMLPASPAVILILSLALMLSAWSTLHWRRTGDGTIFVGIWWAGVSLAPSLAVTFANVAVTPVAERYLMLPSAGAALAFGGCYARLMSSRWSKFAASAATLIALAYLAGTIQRGYVWLSDLRLWTDATAKSPQHGIPWVELGKARMAAGDPDGAIEAFLLARDRENNPRIDAIVEFNLGAMFAMRGQIRDARSAFEASLAANPSYARAHYGLGRLLYEEIAAQGSPPTRRRLAALEESAKHLERAIALAPTFVNAYISLARTRLAEADTYAIVGNSERAIGGYLAAKESLGTAAGLDPGARQRPDVQELDRLISQRIAAANAGE